MNENQTRYVPALKYRWLTPLYDPVLRYIFREDAIKVREDAIKADLVARAGVRPSEHVLDLGCGTGTLAILLKRSQPEATVVGLDGDPIVLATARGKATAARIEISWDLGMAHRLPYPDASFDLVVASLMLHHLTRDMKARALAEAFRVLRPGGRFLAADFGPPQNAMMRPLAKISEFLEETEDGVEGRLPHMFRSAGFDCVEEAARFMTPLGTVAVYASEKPVERKTR